MNGIGRVAPVAGEAVEGAHAGEVVCREHGAFERPLLGGARVGGNAVEILAGEKPLGERRKGDATDAEIGERVEMPALDPAVDHGIGRLVDEQRRALGLRTRAASRVRSGP